MSSAATVSTKQQRSPPSTIAITSTPKLKRDSDDTSEFRTVSPSLSTAAPNVSAAPHNDASDDAESEQEFPPGKRGRRSATSAPTIANPAASPFPSTASQTIPEEVPMSEDHGRPTTQAPSTPRTSRFRNTRHRHTQNPTHARKTSPFLPRTNLSHRISDPKPGCITPPCFFPNSTVVPLPLQPLYPPYGRFPQAQARGQTRWEREDGSCRWIISRFGSAGYVEDGNAQDEEGLHETMDVDSDEGDADEASGPLNAHHRRHTSTTPLDSDTDSHSHLRPRPVLPNTSRYIQSCTPIRATIERLQVLCSSIRMEGAGGIGRGLGGTVNAVGSDEVDGSTVGSVASAAAQHLGESGGLGYARGCCGEWCDDHDDEDDEEEEDEDEWERLMKDMATRSAERSVGGVDERPSHPHPYQAHQARWKCAPAGAVRKVWQGRCNMMEEGVNTSQHGSLFAVTERVHTLCSSSTETSSEMAGAGERHGVGFAYRYLCL
ncbi:hypothetical protein FA15DRAFT_707768 [Coprinopsis marcescibilis]|uniref:Uncharacterized protein n=1 Tax=Coprinopsis marcescibilis TaxID=230819 RepID=A0A5C3KKF5_COPMA|nr:hypothetical protein FA15DRAFT_707768 [Coprinopsis marcescibilis]